MILKISSFNYKKGIIFAIIFTIVLMIFYITIVTKIDFSCKNSLSKDTFGCKIYLIIDGIIKTYSNSIMLIFDKRCYGHYTPDDCIGPAMMLMIITLFIIGFIIGGILYKKDHKNKKLT